MRNLLIIAAALLKGGGRRTVLDLALTVFGVAVPVAVTLLVLGTIAGFSDREDRAAWKEPSEVAVSDATALQRFSYQPWRGNRIDVVEFKELASGPPVPPGMAQFPAPGEIWVSSQLRNLLGAEAGAFESRLGGSIVGELSEAALSYADELVAVVGNPDLFLSEERLPWDHRIMGGFARSDVLAVNAFATEGDDPGLPSDYRLAALIAGALLVAPSVSLVGAAVRLTAARRGRRLAALRLAGATAGQVRVVAGAETLVGAGLGVVLGWVVSLVGAVLAARVTLGGGRFEWTELTARPLALALVVVAALVVSLFASTAALRAVAASPLGVVRQTSRRPPSAARALVVVAAFVLLFAAVPFARQYGEGALMVPGIAAIILSISAIGPLFTWVLGRAGAFVAPGPRTLIAGRRLMSDPAGSFRPTAGVVLISFVAGFILVGMASLPPSIDSRPAYQYAETLESSEVVEGTLERVMAEVPGAVVGGNGGVVMLPEGTDLEEGRDLLARVLGGIPITVEESEHDMRVFSADLRKGTAVVVFIALIQAAFATGVSAAGSILEQANTLAALNLAGTPMGALQSARGLQAVAPITVASTVMVGLGVLAGGATILGATSTVDPVVPAALQAGLVVVGAAIAGLLGTMLTSPVMRSVLRRPLAER